MQNSSSDSSAESPETDQTTDALRELILEQARDLAATRMDLTVLAKRFSSIGGDIADDAVTHVEVSLSPETTQRIAQVVSELGNEAANAAAATASESATTTTKLLVELLTELVTEGAKRALTGGRAEDSMGTTADASTGTSLGAVSARAGLVEQPTKDQSARSTADDLPASASSDMDSGFASDATFDDTTAPLTLDALDDPFLEALIRHEELSS